MQRQPCELKQEEQRWGKVIEELKPLKKSFFSDYIQKLLGRKKYLNVTFLHSNIAANSRLGETVFTTVMEIEVLFIACTYETMIAHA